MPGVEKPLVLRLDSWYLEHLLTGAKQEIVNESNGRAGLATESELLNDDTTKVYEWFRSMYDDGLLNTIPYSQPYDQLFAMALGTSSMLIDTSTAITSVNSAIEGTLKNEDIGAEDLGIDLSTFKFDTLKIGVGLNPGFTEAGQGQIGGAGWYMVDNGDDAATSASWDFLSYFNETPNQVRWTLEGSYLPVSEAARNDPALQKDFAEYATWSVARHRIERSGRARPGVPRPGVRSVQPVPCHGARLLREDHPRPGRRGGHDHGREQEVPDRPRDLRDGGRRLSRRPARHDRDRGTTRSPIRRAGRPLSGAGQSQKRCRRRDMSLRKRCCGSTSSRTARHSSRRGYIAGTSSGRTRLSLAR